jgi:uncharacterized protein YjgD (DUF1641 family)
MDASDRPPVAAGAAALTERQLSGLALLGELGARLGEAWRPEFAQPLTQAAQKAGDFYEKHDVVGLADEVLSTLGALRDSGLLAAVRDNAAFLAESWEQLQPMLQQLLPLAQSIPWATLRQDLDLLMGLLDKLRAFGEFFDQHLAAQTTETLSELGDLWQRTRLDAALRDAAVTLGALHRDGTLARLRDASGLLAGMAQNSEFDSLARGAIDATAKAQALAALPELVQNLNKMAEAWMATERSVQPPAGGIGALLRIMRDPSLQRLLQRAAAMARAIDPAAGAQNRSSPH